MIPSRLLPMLLGDLSALFLAGTGVEAGAPGVPGLEWTLNESRAHWTLNESYAHWTLNESYAHWTLNTE